MQADLLFPIPRGAFSYLNCCLLQWLFFPVQYLAAQGAAVLFEVLLSLTSSEGLPSTQKRGENSRGKCPKCQKKGGAPACYCLKGHRRSVVCVGGCREQRYHIGDICYFVSAYGYQHMDRLNPEAVYLPDWKHICKQGADPCADISRGFPCP